MNFQLFTLGSKQHSIIFLSNSFNSFEYWNESNKSIVLYILQNEGLRGDILATHGNINIKYSILKHVLTFSYFYQTLVMMCRKSRYFKNVDTWFTVVLLFYTSFQYASMWVSWEQIKVDDNVPLSIFFFEAKTYVFQYNQSK